MNAQRSGMLLRSGERTCLHTIPVSLFVLVVLLCIATQSHAARRLHFYAVGGPTWNLNGNITRVEGTSRFEYRLGAGVFIEKSPTPNKIELIAEVNTLFKETINAGAGLKLNFGEVDRPLNFHVAGLIGVIPEDKFNPWFGFYTGVECFGFTYLNIGIYSSVQGGFNSPRKPDMEMPVTIGLRF